MKKYLIIFLSFLSVYCAGQADTTKTDTTQILTKIKTLEAGKARLDINKELLIPELSFKTAETAADSAALMNSKVKVIQRYVRFDPKVISERFPEAVSIDHMDNRIIDYDSFIPILMQVVSEQQKEIERLTTRISEIEKSIK